MGVTEQEKLKVLLAHWIEHNSEHADEFKEWAEKAKSLEGSDVSTELFQAAQGIEQANEWLNRALGKLKGTS